MPRRPQASAGFSHAGFCLHQIGRTREAKELLLRGPTALLKEPIYYYNMGCYDVLLGNLKDARVHLQISFKMDSSFRDLAKRDPDLETASRHVVAGVVDAVGCDRRSRPPGKELDETELVPPDLRDAIQGRGITGADRATIPGELPTLW